MGSIYGRVQAAAYALKEIELQSNLSIGRLGLDKDGFGVRQRRSLRVEDARFGPVAAAFTAEDAPLDAQGGEGWDGAKIVDLKMPRHR